jgi:hypothetical protein
MYYLAQVFPFVRKIRIPLTRDQVMLLMLATNEIFLGIDIYIAHEMDGIIKPFEWIPILFGPVAGVLLLFAGLISLRKRLLANSLATVVFLASLAVGLLGSYFHLHRALLPNAPAGQQATAGLLVWAPPVLGPLMFCLVAVLGLAAAWVEEPADSGKFLLFKGRILQFPVTKAQVYFIIVGLAILSTVLSSILDHARTGFTNTWLWLPTAAGVFGTVVAVIVGFLRKPAKADLITYLAAMALLAVVGLVGAWLHVERNLSGQGTIILERFFRGAPVLAPLLFADMAALGGIVLLEPHKEDLAVT